MKSNIIFLGGVTDGTCIQLWLCYRCICGKLYLGHYSERLPIVKKAIYYFGEAEDDLKHDMDSDGRRVMAYYEYYILGQKEQAKRTAMEGLKVIDKFSICDEEREQERKLLEYILYEAE